MQTTVRASLLAGNLMLKTNKTQNGLGKTQRSVILQKIIPLALSLEWWSNSDSDESFAPAIAFQMKSWIEYFSI